VLPAGFGSALTGDQPRPLTVVVDVGKRITADVTASIGDRIASQLNAVRLAITAALGTGTPTSDPAHVQRVIDEGQRLTLGLDVQTREIGGLYSPIAYYAPSMGMLFLFFTIGAGARSLITERQQGTLQRVRAAPVSDAQILLGKSVSVLVLGLASLVVIWAVTSTAFHAAWGDPLAVLVVVVGIVLSTAGISLWITAVARTEAQAQGFTSIVAFVMALLGGNFLSPGSMPPLLQKLALLTPNGWALRSFTNIGAAGWGVVDVLPAVAVMVGIGVVAGFAGLRGLAGKVAS
jgi:ABC-2 type transport system permease protein